MRAEVTGTGDDLMLTLDGYDVCDAYLSEHDLRDLEFVLAQRRAMSRRCGQERGEHTCGNAPGHRQAHLCRACTESWSGRTISE